jgi:putative ABC transport system permease protein
LALAGGGSPRLRQHRRSGRRLSERPGAPKPPSFVTVPLTRGDLIETVTAIGTFLSALGGVIGIGFGLGLSWSVTRMLAVPFLIQPGILALAFGFSALVGILFGFLPARKAAQLNPIEALRHE